MSTAIARKRPMDLVREVYGNVSPRVADFLLWERTAFPMADQETIRRQLKVGKMMDNFGFRPLCDFCSRPASGSGRYESLCSHCEGHIDGGRAA